jgi:hypothetical protein
MIYLQGPLAGQGTCTYIDELVCYFDSLHYVNPIKYPQVRSHIHAILIEDTNELLSQTNILLHIIERNQYVDCFAKLGASSDIGFLFMFLFQKKVFMILSRTA